MATEHQTLDALQEIAAMGTRNSRCCSGAATSCEHSSTPLEQPAWKRKSSSWSPLSTKLSLVTRAS